MASETQTAVKYLAYDGDCPMCLATIGLLVRWRFVQLAQTRSSHDLDGEERDRVLAAGMRNQLVALDPGTGETRLGVDGILWVIDDNSGYRVLVRVLSLPGVRQVLGWGYRIISYNRRVISPPRHQIVCDCEPEVTLARRLSLIVPVTLVSGLLTAGSGAATFRACELGSATAGAVALVMLAATQSLLLLIAALALLSSDKRIDYLAHLAVTWLGGLLIYAPASAVALSLPVTAAWAVDGVAALVACGLMVAMQSRRVGALRLSPAWIIGWVAATLVGLAHAVHWLGAHGWS